METNKKCLPMYSQAEGYYYGWESLSKEAKPTYNDFKFNGQYCKSGLAFDNKNYKECGSTNPSVVCAMCTKTYAVKQWQLDPLIPDKEVWILVDLGKKTNTVKD
jgi:hypothetical protein